MEAALSHNSPSVDRVSVLTPTYDRPTRYERPARKRRVASDAPLHLVPNDDVQVASTRVSAEFYLPAQRSELLSRIVNVAIGAAGVEVGTKE